MGAQWELFFLVRGQRAGKGLSPCWVPQGFFLQWAQLGGRAVQPVISPGQSDLIAERVPPMGVTVSERG